jgi:hypothetical protein
LRKRVEELNYEEPENRDKAARSGTMKDLASQGVLECRAELQSIGYENEVGFDSVWVGCQASSASCC